MFYCLVYPFIPMDVKSSKGTATMKLEAKATYSGDPYDPLRHL